MEKDLTLVDMTMGSPYFNPHINRPYNKGGYVPPEHPAFAVWNGSSAHPGRYRLPFRL